MLQQGIISPVTAPTEWYFGILPVPKSNKFMDLYRPSTTEQSVAARKLSHGFCRREPCHARWKQSIHKIGCQQKLLQIPLDEDLKLLTTFVTTFVTSSGCFCFGCPLALVSLHSANYGQPCWRTWMESYAGWMIFLYGTWCTCLSSFVSPLKSWTYIEHS